jgi:hypothetical protein
MIKEGGSRLGYDTCYFDPLRSRGKPPCGGPPPSLKQREFLTKVTVVGFSIVTQICGTCVGLCASTNPTTTVTTVSNCIYSHIPNISSFFHLTITRRFYISKNCNKARKGVTTKFCFKGFERDQRQYIKQTFSHQKDERERSNL